MLGPAGLLYKVNPPLRTAADVAALRNALKNGEINWIESDHAPHALVEKLYAPYASGFPSLCLYRQLVEELLPAWGLDNITINKVTGGNIRQVFKMET
jgi:dihydroorotase